MTKINSKISGFASHNNLVDFLIKEGYLKTQNIIDAFKKIDRKNFVINYLKNDAYKNAPLGIGFGQTISQPLTVAFMLELLQAKNGMKILDIGFGSGWLTALLAEIVSDSGMVWGMEIVPELYEFGKSNINRYGFISASRVNLICGDAKMGLEKESPFDGIISSASCNEVPEIWKRQLKIGGRLVIPMNNNICLITKKSARIFDIEEHPGFIFVPLFGS